MLRLTRRLAAKFVTGLVMIWLVASATFFLLREMPGNPAQTEYAQLILHGMAPDAAKRATAAIYGFVPKQPLPQQYLHYLWQLLHFNLGQSIAQEGTPVSHIVGLRLPVDGHPRPVRRRDEFPHRRQPGRACRDQARHQARRRADPRSARS